MTWIPDNSIREEACRGSRGVTGLHNIGSERSFSVLDTPATVGIADFAEALVERAEEWICKIEGRLYQSVQDRIDVITDKARRNSKEEITFADRAFLRTLYGGMVVGAYLKDWPESAQLMLHYLGPSGEPLEIDSRIYQNSERVKKEMDKQKKRIASVIGKRTEFKEKSRRILADYNRLKYADNRFILTSQTHRISTAECMTTWRVDNRYDFEGFKGKNSKWSEFPFRGERIKIYDGLSKYLVELGIAAEFEYWASWQERWKYSGR